MSEFNAPFNRPGQPKSADAPFDWDNPFPDLAAEEEQDSEASQLECQQLDNGDRATVAAAQSTSLDQTASASASTGAAIAAWSEMAALDTPPDLADLISLIQELNQCNSILLDRVSQLEDALEHSQKALQVEVGPLSRGDALYVADGFSIDHAPENLAAAQAQLANLFNQLEFAHQTNHRQQILVETLTSQVENNQERVAQLEREAALLQQRYNEQAQLLAQSENTCRDLQARLQRQQRYTLQFKAALEKSLEVPSPQYELSSEPGSGSEDIALLPKAQRIQPWSSPSPFSSLRFPWMKTDLKGMNSLEPDLAVDQPAAPEPVDPLGPVSSPAKRLAETTRLKLPAIALPMEQDACPEEPSDAAASSTPANPASSAAAEVAEPLLQKLDAAVQPLADLLADAVFRGDAPTLPDQSPAPAPQRDELTSPEQTAADELLKSVMSDAEDALWQDLARLMDGSTEDMVKASLSGDFNAFKAINFEAIQTESSGSLLPDSGEGAPELQQPLAEEASLHEPAASASPMRRAKSILPPPLAVRQTQPVSGTTTESSRSSDDASQEDRPDRIPALATNSSWPSPIVYPLRPMKKRQSPGTVDLPNFLRQETPDPLPTQG